MPGHGPEEGDRIEFEAAMYKTNGEFVDFYTKGTRNIGGTLNASGDIVRRIRTDVLLEIEQVE
jgi:hypothetical protein